MAGRIISILFILSINFHAFVSESTANMSCAKDLPSFVAAFSSNKTSTDNILRIKDTFYPQNKAAPHYVFVYYCYQEPCDNKTNVDYTYIWADNAIFFVVDYYLFKALTFQLAELGDIGKAYFVIREPCNSNDTENLLLVLTSQLKSIGGTYKGFHFARKLNEPNENHDYDNARRIIAAWLFITTFTCILIAHVLMCFKETREQLGKYVKKYVQKYAFKDDRSGTRTENESALFFFLQKALYPIMAIAVITITITDFILFFKYRHTSYQNFLSLFPIPAMAVVFFIVNAVFTLITSLVLVYQKILPCDCSSPECFLIPSILFLLFGITYLFYHGFWIIVALLAYPGRILVGSIFIVPAISVVIPTWTILVKVIKSFCQACCCSDEDDDIYWLRGYGWSFILILDVTIWGLFIAILYYMSKFLLISVDLENKIFLAILSFISVSAISVILIWLNTDLIPYQRDNEGNQQTKETKDDQEDELTQH